MGLSAVAVVHTMHIAYRILSYFAPSTNPRVAEGQGKSKSRSEAGRALGRILSQDMAAGW